MAEYRPYRNVNGTAQARLMRVKFIAVSSFLLFAVLINWMVTQHCGAAVRLCAGTRAVLAGQHLCAVGVARLVDALALGGAAPAAMGCVPASGGLSAVRCRGVGGGQRDHRALSSQG